jgi:predicted enzyme related to lactoylglutathione lyase
MPADPFDVLRQPLTPMAPRQQFAAALRHRLAERLGLGAASSHTPEVREYTPSRLHTLTPYLACTPPDAAIEWYANVFDARLLSDPIIMPDGSIGHAELAVGDSVFFLAGEYEPEQHFSPTRLGGETAAFSLYVPDVDATVAAAVAAGADLVRPIGESYGARNGVIRDPFGHRWFVATHLEPDDVPVEDVDGRRYGDIGYMTLGVPDGERARRFYGALFGWTFAEGHEPGSFHIASITPPSGVHGGAAEPEVRLFFRVDDIESAVARVRELGGDVLTITDYESGGNAECVDDQGLRFDLFRPRAGY